MPSFVYRAADTTGRVIEGVLDGESEADVARTLAQRSLTPLRMRRAKSKRAAKRGNLGMTTRIRLKQRQLLEFTRQLKVMLASGVTLLSTLALLRQRAKGDYQQLLDRIAGDIQSGATLSEALAAHPRSFDAFYIGTILAGEAGGISTAALDELIAYHERRATLRREILSALMYPPIVVAALIGACIVMLTWVVPQFKSVFAAAGGTLPLPTRVLLAISQFVTNHAWELGAGVIVSAIATWFLARLPAVRSTVGHALAQLPVIGHVFYLSSVVQFSRMTALLERAGLPLLESLKVVEDMLMVGPVKTLTADVRRKVTIGSSISDAVTGKRVLPELIEQMIAVGEQTGRIDETLSAAATHYEENIRLRIKQLTTALEPALTLVVSALVLGLALAIFLPMWETNTLLLKR
ncbi:MAG: type II secretion system F family protein [Planctomycetes bacterium]|nr:type II secretion system F family protein [Planctomycetota bacterium]